jgi:hypothetical protein
MLQFEVLRNHAGIAIVGDYLTLRALHELIHRVDEQSPLTERHADSFLALAYDLRKAADGLRRKVESPELYPEIGPRFGVEILWPVLLYQCCVLRSGLEEIAHTSNDQSLVYALEHVVETGLAADFGDEAGAVFAAWRALDLTDAAERLRPLGAIFCAWTAAERKQGLAELLKHFSITYEPSERSRTGNKVLIAPGDIQRWRKREWVDPNW